MLCKHLESIYIVSIDLAREDPEAGLQDHGTYINYTSKMSLDGSTTEKQVDLILVIAISLEILNHSQTGLTICDCGIVVVLFTVLID